MNHVVLAQRSRSDPKRVTKCCKKSDPKIEGSGTWIGGSLAGSDGEAPVDAFAEGIVWNV
jgi:hypothetical protein